MTIKEYMKKVGVSKRKYVEEWVAQGLIPRVRVDVETGELFFPPSARRPYRPRLKANADATVIRASILNACLKREYISEKTYKMSRGEFLSFIDDLKRVELIRVRNEDGIEYYDSTVKSDAYRNRSIKEIRKFIIDCLGSASYGVTKAIYEEIGVA